MEAVLLRMRTVDGYGVFLCLLPQLAPEPASSLSAQPPSLLAPPLPFPAPGPAGLLTDSCRPASSARRLLLLGYPAGREGREWV